MFFSFLQFCTWTSTWYQVEANLNSFGLFNAAKIENKIANNNNLIKKFSFHLEAGQNSSTHSLSQDYSFLLNIYILVQKLVTPRRSNLTTSTPGDWRSWFKSLVWCKGRVDLKRRGSISSQEALMCLTCDCSHQERGVYGVILFPQAW